MVNDTNCEACWFFFDLERPATQRIGWDQAPVCDWHATGSWVTAPRCGRKKVVQIEVEQTCDNVVPCTDHEVP